MLAGDREVRSLARTGEHVRLLWDVCQVPDFRNVLTDAHTWLLGRIFRHLRGPAGRLPEEWVASQVRALDRTDGNTDALLTRLASHPDLDVLSPTATGGSRTRRTGRSRRGRWRTASRTRCTNG